MVKKSKVGKKEGAEIVAKNLLVTGLSVAPALVVGPVWAIVFSSIVGLITTFGEFGQARTNEVVQDLEKHRGSFDKNVVKSEAFKSALLSVLEKHIKEISERKRKLLRNYLISFAQGKEIDVDYHTKVVSVIDQITPEELRLFMLLPSITKDFEKEMQYLKKESGNRDPRQVSGISQMNPTQIKIRLKNWNIEKQKVENLIKHLGSYGLIDTVDASVSYIGGSSTETDFLGVTDVGMTFYRFINDEAFSKEITSFREFPTGKQV